jgi:AcrR family transcriptional regulator
VGIESKRGPYNKGLARREEIIEIASQMFRRTGYDGTSMREIASECGISQTGLLHHFPTKQALLLALASKRDDLVQEAFHEEPPIHWADEAQRIAELNMQNLDYMHLWQRLGVEAIDPANPAHSYFASRYQGVQESFVTWMAATAPGATEVEKRIRAQLLIALWDGLNFQQLLLDDFDMMPAFNYALKLLQFPPIGE